MNDSSNVKVMDILYNILLDEDLLDLKRQYLAEYSALNYTKKESNHINIEKDFFINNELEDLIDIISLKSTQFFRANRFIFYKIPNSITSRQMTELFKDIKADIRNKKISRNSEEYQILLNVLKELRNMLYIETFSIMKHIHCKRFSIEYKSILMEETNRLIQCLSVCNYLRLISKKIKIKLGDEEQLIDLCEEKLTLLLSKNIYIWYKQNSIINNRNINLFDTLNKTMFLDRLFKNGSKFFEEIALYSKAISIKKYNEFLKEEIYKNNKLRIKMNSRNSGFLNYYKDKSLAEIHEQWNQNSRENYSRSSDSIKMLNLFKSIYIKNNNKIKTLQKNY